MSTTAFVPKARVKYRKVGRKSGLFGVVKAILIAVILSTWGCARWYVAVEFYRQPKKGTRGNVRDRQLDKPHTTYYLIEVGLRSILVRVGKPASLRIFCVLCFLLSSPATIL